MQIEAQVRLLNKDSALKGVADLTFDKSFVVKGIFIREGQNGMYLTFPSSKIGDEYKQNCFPITAECRQEVIDTVLAAYEQKLSAVHAKEQDHGKEHSKTSDSKAQTHSSPQTQENSATHETQDKGHTAEGPELNL